MGGNQSVGAEGRLGCLFSKGYGVMVLDAEDSLHVLFCGARRRGRLVFGKSADQAIGGGRGNRRRGERGDGFEKSGKGE